LNVALTEESFFEELMGEILRVLSLEDTFLVRVTPKASHNRIVVEEMGDGPKRVRVYVSAVAQDGKANKAAIALLAKALGVPKSRLDLLQGHKSRDKTFRLLP
jgi:uncharacterized protein